MSIYFDIKNYVWQSYFDYYKQLYKPRRFEWLFASDDFLIDLRLSVYFLKCRIPFPSWVCTFLRPFIGCLCFVQDRWLHLLVCDIFTSFKRYVAYFLTFEWKLLCKCHLSLSWDHPAVTKDFKYNQALPCQTKLCTSLLWISRLVTLVVSY